MASDKKAASLEDVKISVKGKLAALWASMMFLYIYADILSLYRPGEIDEIRGGMMGPLEASQVSLLAAAVLMIIPALMVFLSLVMRPTVNRWTNVVLGVLFTLVNIGNIVGESWAYYLVFGGLEIVLSLLIVRYAWQWPNRQSSTSR